MLLSVTHQLDGPPWLTSIPPLCVLFPIVRALIRLLPVFRRVRLQAETGHFIYDAKSIYQVPNSVRWER